MSRALATIALLILSNTFMTLAWYGHIAFKSKIERFGMLSIILLSWGIALFEYCFQVPANRIGSSQLGGPFSIWELKVIQEVISLLVFTVFAVVFMKSDTLRWNHLAGFVCLILAVGGGSVIDCAKFISLGSGIGDDEDLWDDYIETGKPAPEGLIPVGVVLTTAATGSEMGDAAVLTNWERNRKLGYTSFPLMPRFSVLDPSYLMTLPAEQTVYGFEDMFCHTCEQYFSYPVDDNLSDEIAEGIQRHILRSWRACLSDPKDYEARSNAMWDSTLALNRIISRGKEEDWVTHGIEHALSAYTDIAHGAGLAVVHPHWMAYVYLVNDEVTARFARWAVDVWGVTPTGKTDRTVAEEGIDRYVDFLRRVGAPLTLSEAGVPDDPASLDKYADHAGEAGGSFVQIHRDDARAILEACKEPVSF